MTNVEFYNLQVKIRGDMINLDINQHKHRKLTGSVFILGQEIKDPKLCETCRFLIDDWNSILNICNCEDSEYFDKPGATDGCPEHDTEDGSSIY